MDKDLLRWLNSPQKEYTAGLNILHRLGNDEALVRKLINEGSDATNRQLLFDSLRAIFYRLKGIAPQAAPAQATAPTPEVVATPKNPELEKATKLEADKYYKILANTRAQLFGLCTIERMPNENNAEAVSLRESLALQIMDMQSDVDIAYSRYRYVCEHGKLPEEVSDADQSEELPTNPILLERKRVNLIKSINKLKAKEATPDRVTLIQQLSSTLKIVTNGVNQFLEG